MIDQSQTNKFNDILQNSKSTLLIFPDSADLDLFLASYVFFSFLNQKQGVRLLSPKLDLKIPKELKSLIDSRLIETELGKENLIVSFPYEENQVDKVSYFIGEHDQRFHLSIKPKVGSAPLDSKDVEFSYAGVQTDLVILCGVEELEKLEQLFFAYENLYKGIDNHLVTINDFIPDFGKLNLDISPANSYCEALFNLIKALDDNSRELFAKSNLPTILLYGIESKNDGLKSPTTSASTFSAVAELIGLGAARLFTSYPQDKKKPIKKKEVLIAQQH